MMADDLTDEELYAKFSDRLIRFATTIVGPAHAEDVMTDGVLAAMRSPSWRRVDNRVNYLYRCVLNAGRMHLRSAGRRRLREERVWRTNRRDPGADDLDAIASPNPEVRAAVAGLSARQRAVIFLTYWEDLDERATADRLGISVGSVRRHLHRARQNIGRQLDADV
jgi:RNA polymerase sigma-70 factor (ECF subfamily)